MTAELALLATSDAQIDALYDEAQRKKDVRGIVRYTAEIYERMTSPLGWFGATTGLTALRGVKFPLYEKWTSFDQVGTAQTALKESAANVVGAVADTGKKVINSAFDFAKPLLIGAVVVLIVAVAVHGYTSGKGSK